MFDQKTYAVLADATALIHAGLVMFVVIGQVLILVGWWQAWQWPRNAAFRAAHLITISFVVLETWLGMVCPLTTLENYYRNLAGMDSYGTSFIAYWMNKVLFYSFPAWVFTLIYSLFFLLVLLTLWVYPPRRRKPV